MRYQGTALERSFRYLYLRFLRLRGSAKDVARGMALGVFIGITPTMGVQMPIALFFAMLLKENKLAAVIGVWISNPMTAIPIYTYNFKIGKYILGTPDIKMPSFTSLQDVLALGHDLFMPLFVGSIVAGIFSAAVAYVATYYIYSGIQKEREIIRQWKLNRISGKERKTDE
ncbi:MAG: DUF2062 domain-containing protein [Proteobacteria bacterium]|nr:DUF2062 domain-containing protein [Pseudomonadota bacterium]